MRIIVNKIRNILKKNEKVIQLGRWSYENANLKADYANHDHCGDIICKDPLILKNTIKKNTK